MRLIISIFLEKSSVLLPWRILSNAPRRALINTLKLENGTDIVFTSLGFMLEFKWLDLHHIANNIGRYRCLKTGLY